MFRTPRRRPARTVAGLLALTFAAFTWAADEPTAKDKDRRLSATLKEVINRGAALYNDGDYNGCYRFFDGAILALRPQLEGRAELLKKIDDGLREAEQHQLVANRAWALYELLMSVRETVHPEAKKSRPIVREEREPPVGDRLPAEKKTAPPPAEAITPPKPAGTSPEARRPGKEVTGKVTGIVTLNGKPLNDAELRLIPGDNPKANGQTVLTEADGSFEFLGVKPGRYVVAIKAAEKDGVLPPRYSDPKQTLLSVNVKPGDNHRDLPLLAKPEELKPKK